MTPKCPDCKRDQDDCICASPASAPEVRESVIEAIAEALGNACDCTRVWSAWSYGTMSQDDFSLVAEDRSRLEEIADAAMIAAAPTPPLTEDQKDAERFREGWTHACNALCLDGVELWIPQCPHCGKPAPTPPVSEDRNKLELYGELLYAVANKFPGESRHQTALRYIRNAEKGSDNATTQEGKR